jgi:hypothetical protein
MGLWHNKVDNTVLTRTLQLIADRVEALVFFDTGGGVQYS